MSRSERDPEAEGRVPAWLDAIPLGGVLLAMVQVAIYVTQADVWTPMARWFWTWLPKELGPSWLLAALVMLPLLGLACIRLLGSTRPWTVVAILVVGGTLMQQGWAWSEQRGFDGMRDRIAIAGHAEYAQAAVTQPSILNVVIHYEEMAPRRHFGKFAPSKPPGTLVFYMVTERAARLVAADASSSARLASLRTVASVVWPFLAMLAAVPLFALGRRFTSDVVALVGVLFYLTTPAAMLITMHLDQVLFPLVLCGVVWCGAEAGAAGTPRQSAWWAAAGGVALYLGMWCSFVLAVALPLAGAAAASMAWKHQEAGAARIQRVLWVAALAAAGFIVVGIGVGWLTGYDILVRYEAARDFHERFKRWRPSWRETVHFGVLDVLEWALWVGTPMALLWLQRSGEAVRQAGARRFGGLALLGCTVAAVMFYVAVFGHTKGETARLWLPWLPVICLLAADGLWRRHAASPWSAATWLISLQSVLIAVTKAYQDFR